MRMTRMRSRAKRAAATACLVLPCLARGFDITSTQLELSDPLVGLVRAGHCERAVSRSSDALKNPGKETLLVAGLMFEAGACVDRDWERAQWFFLRAAEGGNRNAMLQLGAGYGSRLGGDPAASLWWIHRAAASTRPRDCWVEGYGPEMTPEAFVEQLNRWGAARVQACTYVAGIWAKLTADRYYPWGAMRKDQDGTVRLTFIPARGVFQAQLAKYGKIVEERQWTVDETNDGRGDLLSYIRNASLKAAQRFARPPEVPAEWVDTVVLDFVFR